MVPAPAAITGFPVATAAAAPANVPPNTDDRTIFVAVCAACHKADGTGLVGPNLMDPEWLHGASDAEVFENIMKGIGPDINCS